MKVVTVHRGARDNYQVAHALYEVGMLEKLVTDLYWPGDQSWARTVSGFMPRRVTDALNARSAKGLPGSSVVSCWASGLYSHLLNQVGSLPLMKESEAVRW